MKIKRIHLKSLKNTRDLSGIKTADNKRIREKLLIRSGNLSKASPEDLKILTDGFGLKTIVDLRTDAEINEAPDPVIPGVEYVRIPLLDSSFLGIARDEYSMKAWLNIFSDNGAQPEEIFSQMYQRLVFSERVKPLIAQFFSVLENSSGAVLWHCSAGKDRVGVMCVLLLSALGLQRDDIIADYMATAQFSLPQIIKLRLLGPFKVQDRRIMRCINVLFGVREEYITEIFERIDNEFGGTENFLCESFGLDSGRIDGLREKFLY